MKKASIIFIIPLIAVLVAVAVVVALKVRGPASEPGLNLQPDSSYSEDSKFRSGPDTESQQTTTGDLEKELEGTVEESAADFSDLEREAAGL